MQTVEDILDDKGRVVHSTTPDATVLEAVDAMCERHIGALLVRGADGPLGIVSERDVLRRVVIERRDPAATRVEAIMTREVVCIGPHARIHEVMALMTERRIRHVPVVEHAAIVGLVSLGDLVRSVSREQEVELGMLTDYVRGTYPPAPMH